MLKTLCFLLFAGPKQWLRRLLEAVVSGGRWCHRNFRNTTTIAASKDRGRHRNRMCPENYNDECENNQNASKHESLMHQPYIIMHDDDAKTLQSLKDYMARLWLKNTKYLKHPCIFWYKDNYKQKLEFSKRCIFWAIPTCLSSMSCLPKRIQSLLFAEAVLPRARWANHLSGKGSHKQNIILKNQGKTGEHCFFLLFLRTFVLLPLFSKLWSLRATIQHQAVRSK